MKKWIAAAAYVTRVRSGTKQMEKRAAKMLAKALAQPRPQYNRPHVLVQSTGAIAAAASSAT